MRFIVPRPQAEATINSPVMPVDSNSMGTKWAWSTDRHNVYMASKVVKPVFGDTITSFEDKNSPTSWPAILVLIKCKEFVIKGLGT